MNNHEMDETHEKGRTEESGIRLRHLSGTAASFVAFRFAKADFAVRGIAGRPSPRTRPCMTTRPKVTQHVVEREDSQQPLRSIRRRSTKSRLFFGLH